MNYHRQELLEELTRGFVLGTMSRRARRRFGRLVDDDDHVAASVHALEAELLPMAWLLQPVEPSELVWQRIARAADLDKKPGKRPSGGAMTSRWPLAASLLFVALLFSSYGWWQQWSQPPDVIVETITETVVLEPSVGVVADNQGNALWVTRIYDDLQRADVSVATNPEQRSSNDYQLWVLGDDGVPVSLGLLPQSGERQLALTAEALDALETGELLAVSLEPLGGSPLPAPTGPVLYTAVLLAP